MSSRLMLKLELLVTNITIAAFRKNVKTENFINKTKKNINTKFI